eukprot:912811-Pelagomonas_calceolata.AAC.5
MILLNMRHALWHAERGPPERGYVPSRASRGGAAKAVRGRPGAVQQELFEAAQADEAPGICRPNLSSSKTCALQHGVPQCLGHTTNTSSPPACHKIVRKYCLWGNKTDLSLRQDAALDAAASLAETERAMVRGGGHEGSSSSSSSAGKCVDRRMPGKQEAGCQVLQPFLSLKAGMKRFAEDLSRGAEDEAKQAAEGEMNWVQERHNFRFQAVQQVGPGPASTNPLIVNEYVGLWEHLKGVARAQGGQGGRVDIIMDNSGGWLRDTSAHGHGSKGPIKPAYN